MTTVLILSCILWVKGDFTDIVQVPVSEYGLANTVNAKSGFEFRADVVEERMNSIEIRHPQTQTASFATALGYEQKHLMTKLTIGDEEASLDCDVRPQTK